MNKHSTRIEECVTGNLLRDCKERKHLPFCRAQQLQPRTPTLSRSSSRRLDGPICHWGHPNTSFLVSSRRWFCPLEQGSCSPAELGEGAFLPNDDIPKGWLWSVTAEKPSKSGKACGAKSEGLTDPQEASRCFPYQLVKGGTPPNPSSRPLFEG